MQRDDVFSRVRPEQLNWITRNHPTSLEVVLDSGVDVSQMDAWELERTVQMVNRIGVLQEICVGHQSTPEDDGSFFQAKLDGAIQAWQTTIEEHRLKAKIDSL
ncbi:hypothetical protein QKT49_gp405 [Acanthamoeba castellanii medusavirus]|uniref:Uncharacterized protein n=1 Tax=Acanthamoeba castellanii medusavirus J1 TaxID=3114988 RepID=A0A3T1CX14_9VIRU|nr:hypothetical protein QKT49_gp405 [Acanthamoeba castellanii medusavirus]BBI30358.1 hypothetical protein [Acanthamoeba castellanii medusavirus J1]